MVEVNKTSKLDFMSSDSVQPKSRKIGGHKNKRISKHKNTICSNCGSSKTTSGWLKTYNKDGNWDGETYHCNACYQYFNHNTGKFSRIPEGIKIGGHKDTVCSNCGSNSTSGWCKKRDENGNWDGKYICKACYHNSACRSGELNPNSSIYKGMIGVETVAKVLGDKDCTIMKQGSPFDICSIHSIKYGKIEVKTVTYSLEYGMWVASNIKPGLFDTLFIVCTGSKFKNIFRVYIIDGVDVGNIKTIAVYNNLLRGGWYEEFRVNDIIQYQKAFKIIKNKNQISKNYVDNGQNSISTKEKGYICEEIVRIAINAEISTDISHDLVHKKYKKIEVKGSDYHLRHKYWVVCDIESFKFDNLFVVCMGSNFEEVQRVYIIPKEDVGSVKTIAILENPSRDGLYEKFRVKDIRPYQEACKKVLKNYGR